MTVAPDTNTPQPSADPLPPLLDVNNIEVIHTKIKSLTEKLKASQAESKAIAKENKALTKQMEIAQSENNQAAESERNLMRELEALSVEVKDLKEKLESTSSENETLPKELGNTGTVESTIDGDLPELVASQAEESAMDDEAPEGITFSVLNSATENETSPKELENTGTVESTVDDDLPELAASQAEEPAMDDEAPEDITFSVLNSTTKNEREGSAENDVMDNRDIPPTPLPNDKEASHPDVKILQTILKAAKGFRDINKRLHTIAESRFGPVDKTSHKGAHGKKSQSI